MFNFWRREVEQTLLRTQQQLDEAVSAKDEFLSIVSHELRTPLTIVIGYSTFLGERVRDDPVGREAVSELTNEARRLETIIENILSMARYVPGQRLELEPVSIKRTVEHVIKQTQGSSGHKVITRIPEDLPLALANQFCVEQVLRNLLSNARKYCPSGTTIELSALQQDANLLIKVTDQGPGTSINDAHRLFEPFYRAAVSQEKAGIGIGLVVCKRLVEAMGGTIWLDQTVERGSSFCFTLKVGESGETAQD
jgi:two-component system sensor histidine kinase KdpD